MNVLPCYRRLRFFEHLRCQKFADLSEQCSRSGAKKFSTSSVSGGWPWRNVCPTGVMSPPAFSRLGSAGRVCPLSSFRVQLIVSWIFLWSGYFGGRESKNHPVGISPTGFCREGGNCRSPGFVFARTANYCHVAGSQVACGGCTLVPEILLESRYLGIAAFTVACVVVEDA